MSSKSRVKVFARFRPTSKFAQHSIDLLNDGKTINIHAKKGDQQHHVNNQVTDVSFKVDGILHNASQQQVYDSAVAEVTAKAFEGYNGTLLAYGQTGAGKTYTIAGATESFQHRGAIPRTIQEVFRVVEEQNDKAITIRISYLEIYNETMFDLLATLPETAATTSGHGYDNSMTIVEKSDGSVHVKGLSIHTAGNEGEALNLLFEGETNRAIAQHSLNKNSSRSHCIFTIHIESRSRTESNARYITSKLNLVDLAGSERIGKTRSTGQTHVEAMYINKSLSFLEQTVIALADKHRCHVPFRQTKLTHALKDSIGGKCATTLIANVYGEDDHLDETVSTLRFAARMMRVPVEAAANEHYDPWLLVHELGGEIEHLKQELAMHNTLANRPVVTYDSLSEGQIAEIKKQVRNFMDGKTTDIDVYNLRQLNAIFTQFRAVASEMEKEMSATLRQRFVFVDRHDPESISALQRAGMAVDDDGNFGTTIDGVASFTSGVALAGAGTGAQAAGAKQPGKAGGKAADAKSQRRSSKRSRAGGSAKDRAGIASPPSAIDTSKGAKSAAVAPPPAQPQAPASKGGDTASVAPPRGERLDSARKDGSVGSQTSSMEEKKSTSRPSSPPPRSQAFEDFRKERGQEINRILNENKTILLSKKRIVRDLAHAVNASKRMIDGARVALERKRNERMEQGEFVNDEGDTVIDEEEFELISQLKKLKMSYRSDYDELRTVKSEVEYCQKLVDQCRDRLVREFDSWYNECFARDSGETSATVGYGVTPGVQFPPHLSLSPGQGVSDDQDKFEQAQHDNLLMTNPDSIAFHNARMRLRRRQMHERAARQPIGTPRVSMRNRPPNQLSVY